MPAVLESAEHLMELGWRLDTLPVDRHGVVQIDALKSLLALVAKASRPRPQADVCLRKAILTPPLPKEAGKRLAWSV